MARILALLVICLVAGCVNTRPVEDGTQAPSPPSRAPATPAPSATAPAADLRLDLVADGLVAPVALVTPGGAGAPSFLVDQTGPVLMLRDGRLLDEPWLDLTDRLSRLDPEYDERGLLGLAFHPAFAQNGRVFVYTRRRPRTRTTTMTTS